jgi:ribosome recycling factor
MADPDLGDLQKRMDQTLEVLKKELGGLRTGRASVHLLDPITVEAYGQQMALNQVASISVPEPRMISVQVWDRGMTSAVDKAIRDSGLGVNPIVAGQLIRIPIPPLSSERRAELTKLAHRYAEHARVAVRNVRRDGMDLLKKMEKDGEMSEDEHRLWAEEVQEMTDKHIKLVDEMLSQKDAEILQV